MVPKTVFGYVTCHSREVDTKIKIKKRAKIGGRAVNRMCARDQDGFTGLGAKDWIRI